MNTDPQGPTYIETSRVEQILKEKLQEIEEKTIIKRLSGSSPSFNDENKVNIKRVMGVINNQMNQDQRNFTNHSSSPYSDNLNNKYNINAQNKHSRKNQQQISSPNDKQLSQKRIQFQLINEKVKSENQTANGGIGGVHQPTASTKHIQQPLSQKRHQFLNLNLPSKYSSSNQNVGDFPSRKISNTSPFIKRMDTMDQKFDKKLMSQLNGNSKNASPAHKNIPQYKALLTRDIGVDLSQIMQGSEHSMSSNLNQQAFKSKFNIDNENTDGLDLDSSLNQFPVLNTIDSQKQFKNPQKSQYFRRGNTQIKLLNQQHGLAFNNNFSGTNNTHNQFNLNNITEPQSASKYQFRVNIKQAASVIKVNKCQRVIWSPDDIKNLQLKKPELNWIFNNVKNNCIQKQINYYQRDSDQYSTQKQNIGNGNQKERGLKRAVIIIGQEQMLQVNSINQNGQQKDPSTVNNNSPLLKRAVSLDNFTRQSLQQKFQISYMQVVPKEIRKQQKKRLTRLTSKKMSNSSLLQHSVGSIISNNTTNLNFTINFNINRQESVKSKLRTKKTLQKESQFKTNLDQQNNQNYNSTIQGGIEGNTDSFSQTSLSEVSLIKKGTQLLTQQVLKELILNKEGLLNASSRKQNNEKDSWNSDEEEDEVISDYDNKHNSITKNNADQTRSKLIPDATLFPQIKQSQKAVNQIRNQFERIDSLRQLKNQRKQTTKINLLQQQQQQQQSNILKNKSNSGNADQQQTNRPDLIENFNHGGDAKVNVFFYHNKIGSPETAGKYKSSKILDQENAHDTSINQLMKKRQHYGNELKQKQKISKWRKLRNLIGGLLRFRNQEATQILTPDQIIEEINRVNQPKIPSILIPPKQLLNLPKEKIPSKTSKLLQEYEDFQNESNINPENLLSSPLKQQKNINRNDQNQGIEVQILSPNHLQVKNENQFTQQKTAPLENQNRRKLKPPAPPKVREIDYFRKVRRFFDYASRGSLRDEQRMLKELKNDIKKHLRNRDDPDHLINIKNPFGKTPLYVACECGNLNIVKMLVENAVNAQLKSQVDKENQETVLQCAARWKHFEIVQYLVENVQWTKQDLKDVIQIDNLQLRIKKYLIDTYQLRYGKIHCKCCFSFWR
eukprot:403353242